MMMISGTMALKNRNAAIKAFNGRLISEDSNNEHFDGSHEEPNVQINLEAQVPQTRGRTAQTIMQVKYTSSLTRRKAKIGLSPIICPKMEE